jgi:oligopeptide transport system ATP-binding protein
MGVLASSAEERSALREPVVEVEHLGLEIVSRGRRRQILDDVSFRIGRGEALGLVGESGSGKSMTARSLTRLLPSGATLSGSVTIGGTSVLDLSARELRRLRASRVAMIFQDPRAHINPVRTVGDFLTEGMRAVTNLGKAQATERAIELLDSVRVDRGADRLRQFPHQLSGGLLQRVMIAAAIATNPQVLIADEPTTALDVTTQSDVMATLAELRAARQLTLLFITHDLELAAATCDRTAVLYAGRVVEERPSSILYDRPAHPYSAALLRARPDLDHRRGELFQLPGRPAESPVPDHCAFAPRCELATDICRSSRPVEVALSDGRVSCHHLDVVTGTSPLTGGTEKSGG